MPRLNRVRYAEGQEVLVEVDGEGHEAEVRFAFGPDAIPDRYVVWVFELNQELLVRPHEVLDG